ncbi:YihY/virulence factor BrkB family protein [Roseiconus lacunae]|uniref:YihY/virulence factor BrkB family protein n=1 Tax=Roseiconus lacunae TaxID=2605694 RepID=A0ABT7PL36_9BACT|nr:YihY/virulence factor BrkB family protein [Roseiconus lacunae]MDM4017220.1 YihY/virulence factor BrkB family protein [Roseiconus lacunae]WRQ51202.1 YihY/virulence factor BrkB family protein [Stieleria sp. HD01]
MNFIKTTFADFSKDRCTTLSAALAYYTIFALPPLLYLLVIVMTFGLSLAYETEQAEQQAQSLLQQQAAQMIGNQAATDEIASIIEGDRDTGGKWWKTLISFVAIVVGATGVVSAIQDALNRVWSVKPDPETSTVKDFLLKRLLSLAMILGLGFLLIVSLVVSTVLSAIGDQLTTWIGTDDFAAQMINYIVQGFVTYILFAAIFKFMPDAEIRWRDVAVGAAITTVLFLLGRFGLQYYLSQSSPGAQLGSAAASLAVILVWVYYSSMIFLLGAEATQVYAVQYGGGIRPQEGAVRVVESTRPRTKSLST